MVAYAEASRDTAHNDRNKMIEVTVGRCSKFESSETNVVKGFIIDAEGLVRVLYELMNRECGIVRLLYY